MEKKAKSDISPPSLGKSFEEKLGGMPPKLSEEQVAKKNEPDSRSRAPGSFCPGGKEAKK